ncbi:oxidoreductase [Physcia stellaris]|nr:oxidoreductase [Physcia stellaris]
MASKPYNVGVIGYGMSAKVFHIPFLKVVADFKLYAVVQRHPNPEDDAEKDHPCIKSYRSTEELVKDEELDVVVVTTVPDTHVELTKLALESGKHVIVEKPFTPTSHEADDLIALAKKHHRLLTVYQNRRYDTDFLTILSLLRSNTLGRIASFETHFDRHRPTIPAPSMTNPSSWKTKADVSGSGAIYDLGTHLIDQAVVAFGLPNRVTGFVGSQRAENPGGFEDSCTVLLHYESMVAEVKAAVFHLDIQEEQLKAGMNPSDEAFGVEPEDRNGTITTLQNTVPKAQHYPNLAPATYKAFYTQFAAALRGDADVPVRPEEAREVIRIIELARRSSVEGKTLDL